ncbi:MAG: (2Fe-2S)-binding protein [Myxococcales bacterium]|nr:(2Fe-2S)-binding protein [Myxococcales bacterium]
MNWVLICDCAGVDRARLRAAFDGGARTPQALERATGAGGGCGRCRPVVRRLVRRWKLPGWLAWVWP